MNFWEDYLKIVRCKVMKFCDVKQLLLRLLLEFFLSSSFSNSYVRCAMFNAGIILSYLGGFIMSSLYEPSCPSYHQSYYLRWIHTLGREP